MKPNTPNHKTTTTLALTTGILWALPYLNPNTAILAWTIPALLITNATQPNTKHTLKTAYLTALTYNLTALYWLLHIPITTAAILAWLTLSAYCALYPTLWTHLAAKTLLPKTKPQTNQTNQTKPPTNQPIKTPIKTPHLITHLTQLTWTQRQTWTLTAAAAWTTTETLQAHLLTGFPWNQLATSQIQLLPLIQIASLLGPPAITFLITWTSLSLLLALTKILTQPGQPLQWTHELLPITLTLILTTTYGIQRIQKHQTTIQPTQTTHLALIQPNDNQLDIWHGNNTEQRFTKLLNLSKNALKHKPHILIWPESAIPQPLHNHTQRIANFIQQHQTTLIYNDTITNPKTNQHYNAALLMNPQGKITQTTHKNHLVPFGEYTPLAKTIPILQRLNPIGTGYTPGTQPGTLQTQNPPLTIGTLICFEDTFPHLARKTAQQNIDLLLNLTNDAWFGHSHAQWQHARNAALRAVETGIPLIRCTNNGITCWIDPLGRIHTQKTPNQNQHQPTHQNIQITTPTTQPKPTHYTRHGNYFAHLTLLLTLLLTTTRTLTHLKTTPNPPTTPNPITI